MTISRLNWPGIKVWTCVSVFERKKCTTSLQLLRICGENHGAVRNVDCIKVWLDQDRLANIWLILEGFNDSGSLYYVLLTIRII